MRFPTRDDAMASVSTTMERLGEFLDELAGQGVCCVVLSIEQMVLEMPDCTHFPAELQEIRLTR